MTLLYHERFQGQNAFIVLHFLFIDHFLFSCAFTYSFMDDVYKLGTSHTVQGTGNMGWPCFFFQYKNGGGSLKIEHSFRSWDMKRSACLLPDLKNCNSTTAYMFSVKTRFLRKTWVFSHPKDLILENQFRFRFARKPRPQYKFRIDVPA